MLIGRRNDSGEKRKTIMKNTLIAVLIALVLPMAWADAAESPELTSRVAVEAKLLDIFPPAVAEVPEAKQGRTLLSSVYTPSGSLWTPGLDERDVFDLEIKHIQDKHNSYDLRLGKGGQIYSLRSSFGESVNPQKVRSRWNDGVWQPVCHPRESIYGALRDMPEEMATRIKQSEGYEYGQFIHGAGSYVLHGMVSGVFTLSCDVMLDSEKPGKLSIILRDATWKRDWLTFGSLNLEDGQITFNAKPVAAMQPGQWQHVEIAFALDGAPAGKLTVSTRDAKGRSDSAEFPFNPG
ncbi:MAG: hypothetical protein HN341_06465, partial [Verrucomicrobia bacterium]|nr:hypothetical protein [Verrucomicrobiota bacterium]